MLQRTINCFLEIKTSRNYKRYENYSVLENDFKTSIEVEENMFNIHVASQ